MFRVIERPEWLASTEGRDEARETEGGKGSPLLVPENEMITRRRFLDGLSAMSARTGTRLADDVELDASSGAICSANLPTDPEIGIAGWTVIPAAEQIAVGVSPPATTKVTTCI